MWKGYYKKEPFDLKLALLRLLFNLHWILLVTILGTLIFGGGYYVKNVLLRTEKSYRATSAYMVEYVDPDWYNNGKYINHMTWNTWINSKEFLDNVDRHLKEEGLPYPAEMDDKIILTARVDSDLRVPFIEVTTYAPELSLSIAKAIEITMMEDFAAGIPKDVASVRVIDPALEAPEVIPDVRPARAFVLSAILSCFFAVTIFLLREWGSDSIWIMSTLYYRYGLKVLDTIDKVAFQRGNLFYYKDMKRIAVCTIDDSVDTTEVSEFMRQMDLELGEDSFQENRWIPVPALSLCGEVCDTLRAADGILLVVKAGPHAGKPLEYALRYLAQQECGITCAILWGEDKKMSKIYYGLDGIR